MQYNMVGTVKKITKNINTMNATKSNKYQPTTLSNSMQCIASQLCYRNTMLQQPTFK